MDHNQEPRLAYDEDRQVHRPKYAVWEVTLACNLRCQHCGSRAGRRRVNELTLAEFAETVRGLAELGTQEITLMGGEVILRPDWLDLIKAVRDAQIRCTILTGGRGFTEQMLEDACRAGLGGIGVSIDGLREHHDEMRGVQGSFDAALSVLHSARRLGLPTGVNTQLGPQTVSDLSGLGKILAEAGLGTWRIGWVLPIGNASEHPELVLQPWMLKDVIPRLHDLFWSLLGRGPRVAIDDGIGYYGPDDHLLRAGGDEAVQWLGCTAGTTSIGIESEGRLKACTSLPTDLYGGASIRTASVQEIWESDAKLGALRRGLTDGLWGFCASCYYAAVCGGGCSCAATAVYGKRGNNPYCHHRVLELERQGLRERIVRTGPSDGQPYQASRHRVVLERWDGTSTDPSLEPIDQTWGRDRDGLRNDSKHRPPLELCRTCHRFVWVGTRVCPHCETDLELGLAAYQRGWREVALAHRGLVEALGPLSRAKSAEE